LIIRTQDQEGARMAFKRKTYDEKLDDEMKAAKKGGRPSEEDIKKPDLRRRSPTRASA